VRNFQRVGWTNGLATKGARCVARLVARKIATTGASARRFCGDCAAPLATACSSCGFTNQPGIRLYRRSGEPGKSGTHIETAAAMYRDMNMKLWLDRT